ncbi:MAG TPA: EfeM/EfeO family lipoprotein [Gryllotalpicola sp.]
MSQRSQIAWFWAVIVVIAAVAVVATSLTRPGHMTAATSSAQASGYQIADDVSHCGVGWGQADASDDAAAAAGAGDTAAPAPAKVAGGVQDFTIANTNINGEDVTLQNVDSKQVFLELESIGPGAKVPARVVLAKGRYRFVCYPMDENPVLGATVEVGAAPAGSVLTPGVVPIDNNQLILAAKAYGAWVDGRLPTLQKQVAQLDDDAEEGDLAAAKADWLTAHLSYETLGAAYDAFGDFDAAINGTPASGTTALTDPDLTGFHKIEALLWSGAPAAKIAATTRQLKTDVAALAAAPGTDRVDPLDVGLRAHEIVENAIQFELTGQTDAGSHTNLATIDANLSGSRQALSFLAGLMKPRYDRLSDTEAALDSTQKLVETFRRSDGSWTPLPSLTRMQHEQLDAAMDRTVELLAPVAEIATPRKVAP